MITKGLSSFYCLWNQSWIAWLNQMYKKILILLFPPSSMFILILIQTHKKNDFGVTIIISVKDCLIKQIHNWPLHEASSKANPVSQYSKPLNDGPFAWGHLEEQSKKPARQSSVLASSKQRQSSKIERFLVYWLTGLASWSGLATGLV